MRTIASCSTAIVLLASAAGATLAQVTPTVVLPVAPPPSAQLVVTPDMTSRFAQVAPRLVRSAGLGPGKTVVINGGAFLMPFMQQLALEVERAGATAIVITTSDSLERFRDANLASRVSAPINPVLSALNTGADVWFQFAGVEDYSFYNARTPAQQAAATTIDSIWRPLYTRHRLVFVDIPLPREAAANGYSPSEYSRITWEAMNADYDQIAATGRAIRRRLAAAHKVRVTSPEGTDITFSIIPNEAFVSAGAVSTMEPGERNQPVGFPGGVLNADVNESSASGRIRAPYDFCNTPVRDEAIDVDRGRITAVHTKTEEECVRKAVSNLHFSFISIGLNPTHPNDPSAPRMATDFNSAGVVLLGLGANWGSNHEPTNWVVPLPRATVLADGVAVVRDGKLVMN